MSKVQDRLPTSDAEPATSDPALNPLSGPERMALGEACGEPGTDEGIGSGGNTLLSRSSPAQGRRSLFRR